MKSQIDLTNIVLISSIIAWTVLIGIIVIVLSRKAQKSIKHKTNKELMLMVANYKTINIMLIFGNFILLPIAIEIIINVSNIKQHNLIFWGSLFALITCGMIWGVILITKNRANIELKYRSNTNTKNNNKSVAESLESNH